MLFRDQKVSKFQNRQIFQIEDQFMISSLWKLEMEVGKIGQVWSRKKVIENCQVPENDNCPKSAIVRNYQLT